MSILDGKSLPTHSAARNRQEFVYFGSSHDAQPRNVKFIKGTFQAKDEEGKIKSGLQRNGQHNLIQHQIAAEADLKRAYLDGYTLQFYGINKWIPSVASLSAQLTRLAVGRPGVWEA